MADDVRAEIQRLVESSRRLTKEVAVMGSIARLLAENEPLGELVMYSLADDELPSSDLWARFKILSGWLAQTEERYKSQFPSDFPKTEAGRYDLSTKPPGFKSRMDIFKEIVEQEESCELFATELIANDPVAVIKRMRT
jgi:hypothetical protein